MLRPSSLRLSSLRPTIVRFGRGLAIAALLAGAGLAMPSAPAYAAGNLMVTPTRVVLNNSQRSTVLSIVNTGTEPTTYRISLVFRRMTEAGELETITTPGPAEELAAHLVRYSPREVTLAPGVTQNVRVQIRKPADLAAGEYRVHMLFLEVPSTETAGTSVAGLNGEKPSDVAVKLTQIYGVSIPLIVRHGETTAGVALRDLQLQPPAKEGAPPTLSLDVQRTGNRSVYGECAATFIGRDGVEKPLGALRNVAVYTPLDHRSLRMALDVPAGLALRQGRVRLTFKETSPPSDKPMAQAELTLP